MRGKRYFAPSRPTPGLDLTRQFHNMPSVPGLFTIQSEFRYEIVRKICDGGMGIVYEAEQHGAREFAKRIGIKVIRQSYASQRRFIKNIMIAFEGDVKLTDFGSAKAKGFLEDQEGEEIAGKADYMSPEQADFKITDRRSDLFSAGVVLVHLLLGRNLFKGQNAEESRQRIMTLPIPDFRELNPGIDERLNQILHRALVRDLEQRYQTAGELLYDLEHYIYHKGYGPTNETL